MFKYSFKYEYKIGDIVYHKISGDKGVVLDIICHAYTGLVEYVVCFGRSGDDSVGCVKEELTRDKVVL